MYTVTHKNTWIEKSQCIPVVTYSTFAQGTVFVKKTLNSETSQVNKQTKSSTIKTLMKNNTSQTVKYRWNIYKFWPSTKLNSQSKCKSKCINSRSVQSPNTIHLTSGYIQVSEVLKCDNKKLISPVDPALWVRIQASTSKNFQVSHHFPPVFVKVFFSINFPITIYYPSTLAVPFLFRIIFCFSVHPPFISHHLIQLPAIISLGIFLYGFI